MHTFAWIFLSLAKISPWNLDTSVNSKLLMTFENLRHECNSYLHFRASSDLHATIFCLSCSSLLSYAFLSRIVRLYFSRIVRLYFCNLSFNLGIRFQSAICLNSFNIFEKKKEEKKIKRYVEKREEWEFNMKFTQ